jgi:hypothetical protein
VDALGGLLLYSGSIGAVLGLVSLAWPIRFIGIHTRRRGLVVLVLGLLGFTAGVYLPVSETRVAERSSLLDEFGPVFQFSEFHSTVVNAPKERIYAAIREVTPEEIRFFKTLMSIRFPGGGPPGDRPILESFTSGWFRLLADDPGREIVFGRAVSGGRASPAEEFAAVHRAPFLRIAMNFRIRELDASHCLLTTETRVYAVGFNMLHGFAAYWRMIRPGSALIRRMWLRATKQRAEAEAVRAGGRFSRCSSMGSYELANMCSCLSSLPLSPRSGG